MGNVLHPLTIFLLALVIPALVVVAIAADFFGAEQLEGLAFMGATLGLGWLLTSSSRRKRRARMSRRRAKRR
jgi:hypothetical protein